MPIREKLMNYNISENIQLFQPHQDIAKPFFDVIDGEREYLGQFLPWVEPTKKVEDLASFMRESRAFNIGGQKLNFFIYYDGQPAGSIGFVQIDKNRLFKAEIGYWLKESLQGNGIITQCCQFMVRHGFLKLKLNRIEIKVMTSNLKSRAIPERLNFIHEGTLRKEYPLHGAFHDIELYSMLKEDFTDTL